MEPRSEEPDFPSLDDINAMLTTLVNLTLMTQQS